MFASFEITFSYHAFVFTIIVSFGFHAVPPSMEGGILGTHAWGHAWTHAWGHAWTHAWGHAWTHAWPRFLFFFKLPPKNAMTLKSRVSGPDQSVLPQKQLSTCKSKNL